jgi:GNAT superfamily N-acetyltransferase
MSSTITIRQITNFTEADLDTIAHIFATAFAKVPLHIAATNNHPELLSHAEAHAALIGGEVYLAEIDGKPAGAAAWFPPGKGLFADEEQNSKAAGPLMQQLDPEAQKWFGGAFMTAYKAEADKYFGPDLKLAGYHLQTIGVLPEFQGKGLSRKLIEHVRDKAIPQGKTLSLEAIGKTNSLIYGKMGFTLLGEGIFQTPEHLNLGEFSLYFMSLTP